MRHADRCTERGFTLVELLVVTVILGVVSSIALVAFLNALDKARQRGTMADMRTISKAVEAYQVDNGAPPDSAGGVAMLGPALIPYQTSVLPMRDHWSHGYTYASDPAAGVYTIESHGKDGVDGADIAIATKLDFNLDIVISDGVFVASPE